MKFGNEKIKRIKIDGLKTYYYISKDGRVYSNYNGNLKERKQSIDKDGYKTIVLQVNGKSKYIHTHQLVAKAYKLNIFNKPQVNHKDGNKKNNYYKNLEWCTNKENIDHAWKTGLSKNGDESSHHILSNKEVHKICKLLETSNLSYKEISTKVNQKCSPAIVKSILYKKCWTDISDMYDFSRRLNEVKTKSKRKLTKKNVKKICKYLRDTNLTVREISDIFNITYDQVANIKYKKTWTDVSSKYF